jgi:hypothetical protein
MGPEIIKICNFFNCSVGFIICTGWNNQTGNGSNYMNIIQQKIKKK